MDRFEYKVVVYDTKGVFGGKVDPSQIESYFNSMGSEGWELINCTSTNQAYGSSRSIVCIFKRKIVGG